jgi:hypothetical protein
MGVRTTLCRRHAGCKSWRSGLGCEPAKNRACYSNLPGLQSQFERRAISGIFNADTSYFTVD